MSSVARSFAELDACEIDMKRVCSFPDLDSPFTKIDGMLSPPFGARNLASERAEKLIDLWQGEGSGGCDDQFL